MDRLGAVPDTGFSSLSTRKVSVSVSPDRLGAVNSTTVTWVYHHGQRGVGRIPLEAVLAGGPGLHEVGRGRVAGHPLRAVGEHHGLGRDALQHRLVASMVAVSATWTNSQLAAGIGCSCIRAMAGAASRLAAMASVIRAICVHQCKCCRYSRSLVGRDADT